MTFRQACATVALAIVSLSGLATAQEEAADWSISGNYAEACTDAPLCGAYFYSPSPNGTCRKALVFQTTTGRYAESNLAGLTMVVLIESGPGQALRIENESGWKSCQLWLPKSADSLQADGLARIAAAMISDDTESPFTTVQTVQIGSGFSNDRIFLESIGRLLVRQRPMRSRSGNHPPRLQNFAAPFPFLSDMSISVTDTLFIADHEPTGLSRRSGAVGTFSWSRSREEARAGAITPE